MPTTRDLASSLVGLSLRSLPTMYQADAGLFCSYRDRSGVQYGVSPRYTLICLIGMHRAAEAGHEIPFDAAAIFRRVLEHDAPTLADAGLRLWASALYDPGRGAGFVAAMDSQIVAVPDANRTGMNVGLALSGLATYADISGDSAALDRAAGLRNRIAREYGNSSSGLFFHVPKGQARRTKPNFATQVYLMHGLARESMVSGDPHGTAVAERCARALAERQRTDGGWPWIYDTSGAIVEDLEVYSVHQDAMAPMAFLMLADAGSAGMWPLVKRGLGWLYGRNALGLDMVDIDRLLIYRSIRRPPALAKIMLAANTASVAVLKRAPLHASGRVELNPTCRPYHLGWILEAWSGRVDPGGRGEGGVDAGQVSGS